MRIYHYVGSFLLGAALIAPAGMLAGTNFQDDHHQDDKHWDRDDKNQRQYYDRNHKDYHNWDDLENRSYPQWTTENHRDNRDFSHLKRKEQSEYWPDKIEKDLQSVPSVSAEQPGMGKAIGSVVGAVVGMSGGALVMAAIIPGVGLITAVGLLGGAILAAAGASVGAVAGGKLENSMTEGLPEDELFVYEDALRKGRSVVIALSDDEAEASRLRGLLSVEGAEAVDAAREQWWIGLRSAEKEHYSALGRNFGDDEQFYRLGFESALHARMRCKEYDQVLAEMATKLEEVQRKYPDSNVEEPFTKGYERGRDHYQQLCGESKVA